MALLPYVIDGILDDYDPYYFNKIFDPNSGLGIINDDWIRTRPSCLGLTTPLRSGYLRSLRHVQPEDSGISTISNKNDEFKVTLDVQQFKPEEIKVKVDEDFVLIEGKHEERQDMHGFVSREFTRKYKLPPNVKTEAISSNLSSDGILSVIAPKKVEAIKSGEREIKVIPTKQPAIKLKKGSGEKDMEI